MEDLTIEALPDPSGVLTIEKLILFKKEMEKACNEPNVFYFEFRRMPRTKKRRIIKKWRDNPCNWKIIDNNGPRELMG